MASLAIGLTTLFACAPPADRDYLLPAEDEKRGCAMDVLAGCADETEHEPTGASQSRMIFDNARRRNPTPVEASRVAHLDMGCTAFFLENTAQRTFMMTAQHCAGYDLASWCHGVGTGVAQIEDNDGNVGRCVRVVAADATHDIAVFEADLPHESSGESTLMVARYPPSPNSRLVLVGYPADDDPNGRLTTTDNCWTLGNIGPSHWGAVSEASCMQHREAFFRKSCLDARLHNLDWELRHNCSNWGGNSGGPMYVEGTRAAIGLPNAYSPGDYSRRDGTKIETASYAVLTFDFVSVHQAVLDAEGIVLWTNDEMANAL